MIDMFKMSRDRLARRALAAVRLEKKLETLLRGLESIPSYKGKAYFVDQVIAAQRQAHSLAWDLARDREEAEA